MKKFGTYTRIAHQVSDEKENLKKFILESYQNWKSGMLNQNAENIEQFSRKNLTQKLVDLMNKI